MYSYNYTTPIGDICITANDVAITGVHFGARDTGGQTETELIKQACAQLAEYFEGKRRRFDVPLEPEGTEFQKSVWNALRDIPYGTTRSYGQIAQAIGNANACRAVGLANNKNPIPIFIPCHRVIGADGGLTGYAGGLAVKKRLLELEKARGRCFEYGDEEIEYLKAKDAKLGRAIDKIGFVEYGIVPDLFEALVYNIVGQQISMKAMDTIWRRMRERFGPITPECVSVLSAAELQSTGITMKKAVYIKDIAERILSGEFDMERVKDMSDDEVCRELSKLKGVGTWTAEMLMIFSLERRDILSWDDLAIRRGMCRLYRHRKLTREKFEKYRRRYSPYGTIASFYLWAMGDSTKHIVIE
jgi:O-6-methylguanine DNA methyltransferase